MMDSVLIRGARSDLGLGWTRLGGRGGQVWIVGHVGWLRGARLGRWLWVRGRRRVWRAGVGRRRGGRRLRLRGGVAGAFEQGRPHIWTGTHGPMPQTGPPGVRTGLQEPVRAPRRA